MDARLDQSNFLEPVQLFTNVQSFYQSTSTSQLSQQPQQKPIYRHLDVYLVYKFVSLFLDVEVKPVAFNSCNSLYFKT